jgi:hypothetical protein
MPFKKGVSGNPAGRKVKTDAEREVEELARKHGPHAIKRLRVWMDHDSPKASVSACIAMLNRAYGQPKQSTDNKTELSGELVIHWGSKPK